MWRRIKHSLDKRACPDCPALNLVHASLLSATNSLPPSFHLSCPASLPPQHLSTCSRLSITPGLPPSSHLLKALHRPLQLLHPLRCVGCPRGLCTGATRSTRGCLSRGLIIYTYGAKVEACCAQQALSTSQLSLKCSMQIGCLGRGLIINTCSSGLSIMCKTSTQCVTAAGQAQQGSRWPDRGLIINACRPGP